MRVLLIAIVMALVAPSDALAKDAVLVKLRDGSKPAKPAPAAKKAAPKKKTVRAAKRKPVRKKTVAKAKAKPNAKAKKKAAPEVRLRPMP